MSCAPHSLLLPFLDVFAQFLFTFPPPLLLFLVVFAQFLSSLFLLSFYFMSCSLNSSSSTSLKTVLTVSKTVLTVSKTVLTAFDKKRTVIYVFFHSGQHAF
uniref:Uncharacterized protein n=1 Tax=Cacopsylla melanoneura TaxID=428564 RepID=A0A8D8UPU1_9HEMI